MSVTYDPHLSLVRTVAPRTPEGCEECLRLGTPWVHLRLCLTCGHVGLLRLFTAAPRSCSRAHDRAPDCAVHSSRARTGAGAMSMRLMSDRRAAPGHLDQGMPAGGQHRAPPETADFNGAYPRLSDTQIAALATLGRPRDVQPHEILFREGDRNCDFFVVLAGNVAILEGHGTPEERIIGVHGRGRFLGELSLLTGETMFYSAMAADPGEVLAVPVDRLRALVARDPALGDLILRAYLIRRSILIGLGIGLRIVGSRYSPDAPAATRLRGPQPASLQVAGPGERPRRRGTAQPAGRDTGGHSHRDLARPPAAAQSQQCRAGRRARLARAERATDHLRSAHRRGRPGRPLRRRVRSFGGHGHRNP